MKVIMMLVVFAATFLSNCSGINIAAGSGYSPNTNPTPAYANYSVFLRGGGVYHRNFVQGQIGYNADGGITKTPDGEACSYSLLYLFSWGDSGIEAAKKSGKITKVAYIEYDQMGVLGPIFHRFCTIAVGSKESSNSVPAAAQPETKPEKKR